METANIRKTASVILLNEKNQILGVSRKYDHNDFGFPGGKLEDDDTDIIEALRRETIEETGLELDNLVLINIEVIEYKGQLYEENTYTGTCTGHINYDPIKEPHVVKWVEPEAIMDGSFGEYNERMLLIIGIKRRRGGDRSQIELAALTEFAERVELRNMGRTEEPPIAKLRNKLGSIVSYFELEREIRKLYHKGVTPESRETIEELELMKNESMKYILEKGLDDLVSYVKNDIIWS